MMSNFFTDRLVFVTIVTDMQKNHLLMYLAGNYCFRINAIAPPGVLG
jgi:hypothetical protein